MKKRIFVLILMLMLLLSSCAKVPEAYTVTVSGVEFTVNTKNHTITSGSDTYSYTRVGVGVDDRMTYHTTIHYPNGGKWNIEEKFVGNQCVSSTVETSEDFDGRGYLSGEILLEAMKQATQQKNAIEEAKPHINVGRLVVGILSSIFGVLGLLFPRQMWNVSVALQRWRYKDLDPTEEGLGAYMVASGILVIVGAIFILIAF